MNLTIEGCVTTWEDLLRKILPYYSVGELYIQWYKGTILATFVPEDRSLPIESSTLVIQRYLDGWGWHDIRTV